MQGNLPVRFGEGDGRIQARQQVHGAPVPTLRDPTTSPEDVRVTEMLVEAGKLGWIFPCSTTSSLAAAGLCVSRNLPEWARKDRMREFAQNDTIAYNVLNSHRICPSHGVTFGLNGEA
jgi:hypothetical protein